MTSVTKRQQRRGWFLRPPDCAYGLRESAIGDSPPVQGGIGSGTVSAGRNGHGGGNGNDSGVVVLVVVAAGAVVVLIVVYRCEDQGKAPSTGNTKSQPT